MKARFEDIERSWELRQEREFNNGEEDDSEKADNGRAKYKNRNQNYD